MRVGVNLLTLTVGKIGGMEQYIRNLLWYTIVHHAEYQLVLFLNPSNFHSFDEYLQVEKVIIEDGIQNEYKVYHEIEKENIELWFCPLLALHPKYINVPTVVTIPDLQHLYFPQFFSEEIINWRKDNIDFSVRKADAIITLSNFSKQTIVDSYHIDEQKIHAIYLDASKEFHEQQSEDRIRAVASLYNLPDKFWFYPANTWPHKNHIRIFEALLYLREQFGKIYNLVLTGSEQNASPSLKQYIAQKRLEDQIQFLGYIPQKDMPYIYKLSSVLVFPSLFEGFGIPLVEAMKTNTLIACSNTGSIPEVIEDCAIQFNANDFKDIAEKLLLTEDITIRENLINKAKIRADIFSWNNTCKQTIDVFAQVLRDKKRETYDFPLVSIVTPSFNQGKFIRETIDSVLNQDYPYIEYWVMDGGSTDETVEILKSYGDKINWVSEKDDGQADAVNKGILRAKGKIIGWLNSDDTYLPDAIKQAVIALQHHPELGMIYGEGYHTDIEGTVIDRYPTESFNYARLAQHCFICQPTVFFRREVFEKCGLLNKSLHLCMDYELWMRIGKDYSIGYIPKFLATSRMYEDNKTLSRRNEVYKEIMYTVKKYYSFVPISWVYGFVFYKTNSKKNLKFIIYFLFYFWLMNRGNSNYFKRELWAFFKEKLRQKLPNRSQFNDRYEDGWISNVYQQELILLKDTKQLIISGQNLSPYRGDLRFKVILDGVPVGKYSIRDKGDFQVNCPVQSNKDVAKLVIVTKKTFNPYKLGVSNDNRQLGFVLDEISCS